MSNLKDNVNHPKHYTVGGIECIDALKAATTGLEGIEAVCTANAIKYLWRWKYKNGIEDLKKTIWYIDRLIEELSLCEYYNNDEYFKKCLDCRYGNEDNGALRCNVDGRGNYETQF